MVWPQKAEKTKEKTHAGIKSILQIWHLNYKFYTAVQQWYQKIV
jgi:hypothetical protein